MLRAAKIYSWLLLVACLILLLASASRGLSTYGGGLLLLLLPAAMALGIFYSRAPRWLAWAAILLNCVAVCLGLYMVGDSLPDLLGLKPSPDVKAAALYLALALFVFVIPGGLNAASIYCVLNSPKPPNTAAAA